MNISFSVYQVSFIGKSETIKIYTGRDQTNMDSLQESAIRLSQYGYDVQYVNSIRFGVHSCEPISIHLFESAVHYKKNRSIVTLISIDEIVVMRIGNDKAEVLDQKSGYGFISCTHYEMMSIEWAEKTISISTKNMEQHLHLYSNTVLFVKDVGVTSDTDAVWMFDISGRN